ncbi:MAG: hypothetical protein JSR27_04050 [Proteobacteria bacterium]|nr:hypothetical protein [Pseudomonadota bacterium]
MPNFLRHILLAAAFTALAACGQVKHPINPPSASIQQLDALPNGQWKLQVRIENFSDQTVHYGAFKAELHVGDALAGTLDTNADMDIPGENADILEVTLTPGADAAKALKADATRPDGVAYELKGTIDIPSAKVFKFEHKSRLSPVPGVANSYR